MSQVSDFIEQQASEGEVVGSDEQFVVHLTKAREKIAIFQQEDPAYCFLRWYQAAVAAEAKEIFFELNDGCYTMILPFAEEPDLTALCAAFDGKDLNLEPRDRFLLEGLLSTTSAKMETSVSTANECHVFSSVGLQRSGWWSRLIRGTQGAYKKNSLQIRLRMKQSRSARDYLIATIQRRTCFGPVICHFALDLKGRPSVVYDEVPLFSPLTTHGAWSLAFSPTYYLLEHWSTESGEDGLLHRTRELYEATSRCKRELDSLLRVSDESGDLLLALPLKLEGEESLVPVQYGVTLAPLRREMGCPGATIVFACNSLDTDLSGFHLREDERLNQRLDSMKERLSSILQKNRSSFASVESNRKERHLAGTFLGVILSLWLFVGWEKIVCAVVLGFLGGWVEGFLRREQLKEAKKQRTEELRKNILERLQLQE